MFMPRWTLCERFVWRYSSCFCCCCCCYYFIEFQSTCILRIVVWNCSSVVRNYPPPPTPRPTPAHPEEGSCVESVFYANCFFVLFFVFSVLYIHTQVTVISFLLFLFYIPGHTKQLVWAEVYLSDSRVNHSTLVQLVLFCFSLVSLV